MKYYSLYLNNKIISEFVSFKVLFETFEVDSMEELEEELHMGGYEIKVNF